MKKTFYITRHGQTLFNAQSKIQGACDSPLTELGIKQAKIAGEHLKDLNINFDLVILDEIFIAMHYNLISYDEVVELIKSKNYHTELVLTGRNAPESLYVYADLITEMKEIKHYYNEGVKARSGIEY